MALSDVIARLAVSLSMDTAAFEKGATLAEKRAAQTSKKMQAFGKSMSDIGAKMSIGITAPLAALAASSYQAAQESADALGQVEATLKSMGDASGRTSAQLQELAKTQMGQSLYDDDEILRKVTANLLTFGNVSGAAFDGAQQAALDLSARLGTDLQSSAVMLGKALNDPVKGITALTRVGVSFTEQQKAQITAMAESGNVAGAQAMILAELEKQYGGAAAAARAADPTAESKQAWADFQETIGELVTRVLPPLTDFLTKIMNGFNGLSPEMQKTVVIGAALGAALGPVLTVMGGLVTVGGPLLAFAIKLAPALVLVGKALLMVAMNPYVLGLAAVIGGIYLAWKNWDKITAIVQRLYSGVKTWMLDKLTGVFNSVKAKIDAVKGWFFGLYDAVVGHSYIPDMVDGIRDHMARLDKVMVEPAKKGAEKTTEAMRAMAGEVQGILDRLFPEIRKAMTFREELATLGKASLGADQQAEAERRLFRELSGAGMAKAEPGFEAGPLGDLEGGFRKYEDWVERFEKKSKDTTVRIAKSFKDMADETLGALQRMTDAIKGGGFLDILQGVFGFAMQLGSIGVFGKTIAGNINRSVPGYANGTNFHPGGLAVVGERGPELVSMPRGSRVTPNHEFGRWTQVQVIPSPYFDVVVDGRIAGQAPAIAQAGAAGGVARMAYRQSRRIR